MQDESNRNTIIFIVVRAGPVPGLPVLRAAARRPSGGRPRPSRPPPSRSAAAAPAGAPARRRPPPGVVIPRAQAARRQRRASPIDTPGADRARSSLNGARIDDLFLKRYRETIDKNSPPVELFRPEGAANAYFADFGWTGANVPGLPDANTVWTAGPGRDADAGQPVTLTYDNGQGLSFTRTIAVDDRLHVHGHRHGGQPRRRAGDARALRLGPAPGPARRTSANNAHRPRGRHRRARRRASCALSSTRTGRRRRELELQLHRRLARHHRQILAGGADPRPGRAGPAPPSASPTVGGVDIYDANYARRATSPSRRASRSPRPPRLFAGAKTRADPAGLREEAGHRRTSTRRSTGACSGSSPGRSSGCWSSSTSCVGNFGVAILLLTVVRAGLIFFPLANKSYESMTKMKKVQPRDGGDPQAQRTRTTRPSSSRR